MKHTTSNAGPVAEHNETPLKRHSPQGRSISPTDRKPHRKYTDTGLVQYPQTLKNYRLQGSGPEPYILEDHCEGGQQNSHIKKQPPRVSPVALHITNIAGIYGTLYDV